MGVEAEGVNNRISAGEVLGAMIKSIISSQEMSWSII